MQRTAYATRTKCKRGRRHTGVPTLLS